MIWSLLEAERTLIDVWRRPKTSRLTHLYHSTINFAVVHNAAFPPWRRHVMPWSSGPACNTRATMISFKGRRNRIDDPRPVGTCKIGDDESAVLDSRLRVRALGGLRVFDPSIMLTITSAYTNAPTIMIAENAADMICADRGSDLVAISTSA